MLYFLYTQYSLKKQNKTEKKKQQQTPQNPSMSNSDKGQWGIAKEKGNILLQQDSHSEGVQVYFRNQDKESFTIFGKETKTQQNQNNCNKKTQLV